MKKQFQIWKHKLPYLIFYVISLVSVSFFFVHIFKYAINFPFYDDYSVELDFINNFLLEDSIIQKIKIFYSQVNEHRLLYNRFIVLMNYVFFNEINFKGFTIIGNFSLIITFYLLLKYNNKQKLSIYYFTPIPLLLFNFRFHEIIFWPGASIANLHVLTFMIISFVLLYHKNEKKHILSFIFALIATYTSGNGMMIFFASLFVLFIRNQILLKRYLIWVISGLATIFLFFSFYTKPTHLPSTIDSLKNPINLILYIFSYLGNGISENPNITIFVGIIIFFYFLFITFRKYYLSNPILYSIFVFVILSALMTGLARSTWGIHQSISSRYSIYSILAIICGYISLLEIIKYKSLLLGLFFIGALTTNVYSYFKFQKKLNSISKSILLILN